MPSPDRFVVLAVLSLCWTPAVADVVVLSNRTPHFVPVRVTADDVATTMRLESGASRPLFADRSVRVEHAASPVGGEVLPLNEAYYFARQADGALVFGQIGLLGPDTEKAPRGPWDADDGRARADLPVLLVVDEEEPTREAIWKRRLTKRIAAVSEVIRAHSGVGLRIVGFDRYRSDNALTVFTDALRQFEQAIDPPPGAVAIGFSSQFEVRRGRRRLGGTRGPLRRHLLLREYSPTVTEAERIEALTHEIGHYLGATHSPEADSVMRPVLGDARTRLKSFRAKFDAVNTLAIAMVGEEVRRRDVRSVDGLSIGTRLRLAKVYATLGPTLPQDPAAKNLARRVVGPLVAEQLRREANLSGPAAIAAAVTAEAVANAKRAGANEFVGEAWTSRLVRVAAEAAGEADRAGRAVLLLGLGFAFDETDALARHPRTQAVAERIDPPELRDRRRGVIGETPTRGRADTTKHFFVSAALTAASSPREADLWGLTKEAIDASGGSGYSFADIAANRAGVRFAERVLDGSLSTRWIAERFDVHDFVPELDGLPEGMQAAEMVERFGGVGDPRFEAIRREIESRIDRLPPYALGTVLQAR